jgi:hypothetical protein
MGHCSDEVFRLGEGVADPVLKVAKCAREFHKMLIQQP